MAFGSEYKSGSGAYFGAPIAIASENPLDPRMVVENYSDLIDLNSWAIQGTDTGNKGFNTAYHGMITAVKAPADKAGLYQLVKSSDSSTAKADLQSYDNWQKISVSEAEFTAILNRVTAVEASDAKKLDKDFVTQSSQGTLGEGTTFAARSDNTPEATNVYITGKQIKDFAASAVSDKGTFADDTALKAAYPTPENGWSATVLSTGTTWISTGGQWTDSGKANGVTSVNGKSGNVTLVAADIDDVLSDTETDQHIQAAFTADRTDLNTTAKTVVGGINEVKAAATKNAGDIAANASAIASKQDSTINLEIQGATAATVSDALTSLDTALTSVKSTADDAAKKDASNIEAATWKTVLGYQNADEVATAVNNGITTNEYSTLATTAKTVKGAIEELKTTVDSKASSSDFTALQGKVTTLETTVGNAEAGLVKDVADNTAAINTANTNIAKKQNTAISLEGIEAKTVEGALTEIKNATATNATAISGKADKATTLAGYGITDAYTKTEVDTELGKKQDKLSLYSEGEVDAYNGWVTIGKGTSKITSSTGDITLTALSNIVLDAGSTVEIKNATAIRGSVIANSVSEADIGNIGQIPTVGAVATAIEGKADKATTLAGYGITDAYTKTETGEQITSAVNGAKSELQTAIDGKVAKTDITTTIAESSVASDTKVPSEKAVASAVEEVKAVASTAYKYKGSDTYENILAKEDPEVGDVWNSTTANGVYPKGTNYAWNGTEWDALGGEVDLSAYQVKAITVGETSTTVEAAINANKTAIDAHIARQDNPHNVTAAQVGLDNVDNTADADKPVSTAQQAALDLKQDKTDNTLATTSKTVVGAINEVKGVADAAAKADASNITVSTWKDKLGFITSDEVPEQVQPDWNATSGKGQILNKPNVKDNGIDTTIADARRFGNCVITNETPKFVIINNENMSMYQIIAHVGGNVGTCDAEYTFSVSGAGGVIQPIICERITNADLSNFNIGMDTDEGKHDVFFENTNTSASNAIFISYDIIKLA